MRASTDANSPWWNVISVRPSRSASVTVTTVSGPGVPCSSTQQCVNTSRSGGTISRYTPRRRCSVPAGERMRAEKAPPTRNSPRFSLKVKPSGQDHCASICGSVQARNTSSRGALKVRRMFSSRSAALFRTLASMWLLLSLQLAEVAVETAEAPLPVATVALGPLRHLAQRRRLQAAGPRLSAAPAAHESGALEHLQVLGDRRLAHGEGARQLHHTRLAGRQAREDGTARRIGERGEGVVEAPLRRHFIKPFGYITERCVTAQAVRLSSATGSWRQRGRARSAARPPRRRAQLIRRRPSRLPACTPGV